MRIPKYQRSKLHHRDEAGKILNFRVRIAAVEDSRKIKELGALIDFSPESFLEGLFGGSLDGNLLD
jgi:hypothetical protein